MARKLLNAELGRLSPLEYKELAKLPLVVVLDNIRSAHNIGSVFRTSDAYLVQAVFLCGFTAQPPNREIHKTALGATETVEWRYFPDVIDAVTFLKGEGFRIVAVEQVEHSISLPDFDPAFHTPVALVFGNEVGGVDQRVVDDADYCLELPQFGTKHSLNISVCAGIVIYDLWRKLMVKST